MRFAVPSVFITLLLASTGCNHQAEDPSSANSARTNSAPLAVPEAKQPQGKLQTMKLYLGPQEISAELAITLPQITTGMMFRTNMAEMEGMLFVFGRPHQAQFWMRNTLLPLSCAYIDPEGTILELHDMKPLDETGIPAVTDQIQYVLEMKQGWFQRNNASTGAVVRTPRGTLQQTFFGH
ncbi:MAG: hypothetical protein JWM99_3061 [Verrucomicrobiales bacterium]|nr:hypothetical protein [Verrucomicrobiales bacterium]